MFEDLFSLLDMLAYIICFLLCVSREISSKFRIVPFLFVQVIVDYKIIISCQNYIQIIILYLIMIESF